MTKDILISVVLPVYNGSKTISQAIDSVLAQSITCEIIVVDDGSTDALREVLQPYGQQVRWVINPVNVGVAASRNRGVTLAQGEYIAFLDADDWWHPLKCELQMEAMKKHHAVMSSTARQLVNTEGQHLGRIIPVKEKITYQQLLKYNAINTSSVIVAKNVIETFPMEKDDLHEDYYTWLSIAKTYPYVVGVNQPLLYYRVDPKSKSGNKLKSAKMHYKTLRAHQVSTIKAMFYFMHYALMGLWKYRGIFNRREKADA